LAQNSATEEVFLTEPRRQQSFISDGTTINSIYLSQFENPHFAWSSTAFTSSFPFITGLISALLLLCQKTNR